MKHLFILLIGVLSFASQAQSQTVTLHSAVYSANTVDTVTNTATKYMTSFGVSQLKGNRTTLSVVANVLEISGTTGGTITLEASMDGTYWYNAYGGYDSTYTFTPADVATAQAYRWVLHNVNDNYFRIKYVGTGTMSAKVSGRIEVSR